MAIIAAEGNLFKKSSKTQTGFFNRKPGKPYVCGWGWGAGENEQRRTVMSAHPLRFLMIQRNSDPRFLRDSTRSLQSKIINGGWGITQI